jgi:lipid II:glycine glycyltransferase (peptidoglycan interpeptide bridge formation enzyme)
MCPILEGKVIYEMFVAGKDGQYKDIYPSILATYAAMKYANEHSIKRFDFMGAGKPDEAYGVREFKEKFGGELVEHGRFLCVLHPLLYKIGKLGVYVLKKL